MERLTIEGLHKLSGAVTVHGAKNSALPILAATLLADGASEITNCPALSDVEASAAILRYLGCRVEQADGCVTVDTAGLCRNDVPDRLMREMRSSIVFLGAIAARTGEAHLTFPGGCELGPRPIDLHLAALRKLGVEIEEERGRLNCRVKGRLTGTTITLAFPSVGATENVLLAAVLAQGTTEIVNAAREPEIVDLQRFLNAMGARVSGAGSPMITIQGGAPLHPAEHTVMGDRIAAATYLCAVGAAGGELRLTGVDPADLAAVCCCLEEAGCRLHTDGEGLSIAASGRMRGIRTVRTAPYPGFPTDAQAILMAALAGGTGTTMIVENMFDSRYRHVDELARMGADIQLAGRVAVVTGSRLHGAAVRSTDLRGGAALVVAALGAEGVSRVSGLSHIRRGYQGLDDSLSALGADIRTQL